MGMKIVNIYKAKTALSALISRPERGDEVIIARVALLFSMMPRSTPKSSSLSRGNEE